MARLGFNAEEVAPDTGGGPLPDGTHRFQAIEESLEVNSKSTGEVLKLTFEVIEGELQGRKLWTSFNIAHQNPQAQAIGQAQFSALCHAIGQLHVEDSSELLWKPFIATTKIKSEEYPKGSGKYTERAHVQKYHPHGEDAPPIAKAPPQPAPRPTATPATRGPAGRPGAPATGARSLPWQNRQAAPADSDIPF